jgi:hypothetical protein
MESLDETKHARTDALRAAEPTTGDWLDAQHAAWRRWMAPNHWREIDANYGMRTVLRLRDPGAPHLAVPEEDLHPSLVLFDIDPARLSPRLPYTVFDARPYAPLLPAYAELRAELRGKVLAESPRDHDAAALRLYGLSEDMLTACKCQGWDPLDFLTFLVIDGQDGDGNVYLNDGIKVTREDLERRAIECVRRNNSTEPKMTGARTIIRRESLPGIRMRHEKRLMEKIDQLGRYVGEATPAIATDAKADAAVAELPDAIHQLVREIARMGDLESRGYGNFDKASEKTVEKYEALLLKHGVFVHKPSQKRARLMRGPMAKRIAERLP